MNFYFLQIILFLFLSFPQLSVGQGVSVKYGKGESGLNNSGFVAYNTALFEKYSIDQLNAQIEYEKLNSKKLEQEIREKKDQLAAERFKHKTVQRNYLLALLGFSICIIAVVVKWNSNIKRNFIRKQDVLKRDLEEKMLTERAWLRLETIEKERERIARNLHDGLSNNLVSLRLQLQSMNNTVPGKDLLIRLAEDTHKEVRAIMHNLSAPAMDNLKFEQLFHNHIEIMNYKETMKVEGVLLPENGWDRINKQMRSEIYRLLQEITGNIIKHSGATNVNVTLRRDDQEIVLLAEDNGVGIMNVNNPKGFGMKNLKTRVEQLKGQLQVDTVSMEGTVIRVQLPLPVA